MVKGFFMAILMAAIFAGLLTPLYNRLLRRTKKKTLSGLVTLLLFILVILLPAGGFLALVVDQAIDISSTVGNFVQNQFNDTDDFMQQLDDIPIIHETFPDPKELATKVGELVGAIGNFVITGLSGFTKGAANFFFLLFICLFTMYYFLLHGNSYLKTFLFYLPLKSEEENLLLSKFTTVTRATLKGTLVIGIIQGAMIGIAMAICGIPNTVFWGVIAAVMSIIPAVGPAVVWIPAAAYLLITGDTWYGIGLVLFGAIVVGNIDNLLRPKLVGKSAQLSDLMVLFGTLGGIAIFGIAGIIIGPIIAALFISLWEIYGVTFKNYLPAVDLPDSVEDVEKEFMEQDDTRSDETSAEKDD
jgi:predicted PurR-regulated permease PerM